MARPKLTDEHRAMLVQLGAAVREQRELAGATLEGVATELGSDRQYVSEVEAGRVNVSATRLIELARAIGVPPGRFLDGVDGGERQ